MKNKNQIDNIINIYNKKSLDLKANNNGFVCLWLNNIEYLNEYLINKLNKNKLIIISCKQEIISYCKEKSKKYDFIVYDINQIIDRKINDIEIESLFMFGEFEYKDAEFLSQLNPAMFFSLIEANSNIDYYEIWRIYCKTCKFIYMSIMDNDKREILEWTQTNNSNIEISVIVPVYNMEKYLENCIRNIISWDSEHLEIIAIDDGSTDSSLEILKRLRLKDKRIVIMQKENGGCASARQLGLENAKGEYVGFVDPDDYTSTDMFYCLHKRALKGNYDVVYTGYSEFYDNSDKINSITDDVIYEPYINGTTDKQEINALIYKMRPTIWRCIYKKSFLEKNNICFNTNLSRFDDLPFKIEVFTYAKKVVAIPKHQYFYRQERLGQDVLITDKRLYVHFDIFEYIHHKIIEYTKDDTIKKFVQIAKVNTHLYSINKISRKYKNEYIRIAKRDIERDMSIYKSALLMLKYTGFKKSLFTLFFTLIKGADHN